MKKIANKPIIILIFTIFSIIFSLISIVNHYLFRTSALDMGVFNHALYNYSHFNLSYFTLGLTDQEIGVIECFGDHFSPFILLLTPFYYLFGTYSLLIVQIAFVLLGAWGIYKYASSVLESQSVVVLIVVQFFSIWGIYSALSFDFHMNVIAAMLVPWLFYFYRKQNLQMLILIFLLMLFARENISIWLVFILAGMWIDNDFHRIKVSKYLFPILITFAVLYFVVVIKYVMPAFVPYKSVGQLSRYLYLGENLSQVFYSIITQPKQTFSLLFFSPLPEAVYQNIKIELHLMVLLSGGFLFIYRPGFLVMLIPIYLQKLLSTDYGMWGINYHYSIEFVPILSLLLIHSAERIRLERLKIIVVSVVVFTTLTSTLYTFFHRESVWYDKNKTCFFCLKHYNTDLNLQSIIKTIDKIPYKASISTHFSLAPHLALREIIYQFPITKDAMYIALLKKAENYYPLSETDYFIKIDELRRNPYYTVWIENESMIIFKHNDGTNEK